MKKKGGDPTKKRSKDNKRKNVKEIEWQAKCLPFFVFINVLIFVFMEDKRLDYENNQDYYFNFTY